MMIETWNGWWWGWWFFFAPLLFQQFRNKNVWLLPHGTHPPNYESRLWPVSSPQRNINFPMPVVYRMICIELRFFASNIFFFFRTAIDNETESRTHEETGAREWKKIKVLEFRKGIFVMETNLLGTEWVNKLKMLHWNRSFCSIVQQCVVF